MTAEQLTAKATELNTKLNQIRAMKVMAIPEQVALISQFLAEFEKEVTANTFTREEVVSALKEELEYQSGLFGQFGVVPIVRVTSALNISEGELK